jgi:hypothetical protein
MSWFLWKFITSFGNLLKLQGLCKRNWHLLLAGQEIPYFYGTRRFVFTELCSETLGSQPTGSSLKPIVISSQRMLRSDGKFCCFITRVLMLDIVHGLWSVVYRHTPYSRSWIYHHLQVNRLSLYWQDILLHFILISVMTVRTEPTASRIQG